MEDLLSPRLHTLITIWKTLVIFFWFRRSGLHLLIVVNTRVRRAS